MRYQVTIHTDGWQILFRTVLSVSELINVLFQEQNKEICTQLNFPFSFATLWKGQTHPAASTELTLHLRFFRVRLRVWWCSDSHVSVYKWGSSKVQRMKKPFYSSPGPISGIQVSREKKLCSWPENGQQNINKWKWKKNWASEGRTFWYLGLDRLSWYLGPLRVFKFIGLPWLSSTFVFRNLLIEIETRTEWWKSKDDREKQEARKPYHFSFSPDVGQCLWLTFLYRDLPSRIDQNLNVFLEVGPVVGNPTPIGAKNPLFSRELFFFVCHPPPLRWHNLTILNTSSGHGDHSEEKLHSIWKKFWQWEMQHKSLKRNYSFSLCQNNQTFFVFSCCCCCFFIFIFFFAKMHCFQGQFFASSQEAGSTCVQLYVGGHYLFMKLLPKRIKAGFLWGYSWWKPWIHSYFDGTN